VIVEPQLARTINAATIGGAWIAVARLIMDSGAASTYDGLAMREVLMTSITVRTPATTDDVVERFSSPERLAWMRANFGDFKAVPELGDADSYATRLLNYAGTGLDQLRGVSDRLRRDPLNRSATITTFQPLTDTSYIPCVSLLDFYVDNDALQLPCTRTALTSARRDSRIFWNSRRSSARSRRNFNVRSER
jgi:hypothetical protein